MNVTPDRRRFDAPEAQPLHGAHPPLIPTGYHHVPNDRHRRSGHETYTVRRLLFDLFCVAWIIPIAFGLYFNFTNMTVGAGIGCRAPWRPEACFPDLLGIQEENRHRRREELNRHDRAWQGGLQFVSKALDMWFAVIATSLVLSATMHIATTRHGLPLGYLLTHASLSNFPILLEKSFWTSCRVPGRGSRNYRIFGFMAGTAILCVACNLMGPATAILIIPHLTWSPLSMPATEQFDQIMAGLAPELTEPTGPQCAKADLAVRNFSCINVYSFALDELLSGYTTRAKFGQYVWDPLPVMTQHFGLLFMVNTTSSLNKKDPMTPPDWTVWVPLGQTMRKLEGDYVEFLASQDKWDPPETTRWLSGVNRGLDYNLFDKYRNALDVVLRRNAPSMGLTTFCARATVSEYPVSATKTVRCYQLDWTSELRDFICHPIGSGWDDVNNTRIYSHFSIEDANTTVWPGDLGVDIYSGTKMVMMENISLACGQAAESCDWERLLSLQDGGYDTGMSVYSTHWQVAEYSKVLPSGASSAVCFTEAYLSFANYSFGVSPDQNFGTLLQLEPPMHGKRDPVAFHPDWLLAAWSVEGPSNPVKSTRPAAINLVSAFRDLGPPPEPSEPDSAMMLFKMLHDAAVIHAMTFIEYNATEVLADTTGDDPTHPVLTVTKSLRVWAYESDSRTFKAAASVCLFGCLIALLRPLVSWAVATKRPSTLRFLVAALRRQPLEKLKDLHSERDIGRVAVRIVSQSDDDMLLLQEDEFSTGIDLDGVDQVRLMDRTPGGV